MGLHETQRACKPPPRFGLGLVKRIDFCLHCIGIFIHSRTVMATITFDTHQFIKTLQAAGFEAVQAEAVANAF